MQKTWLLLALIVGAAILLRALTNAIIGEARVPWSFEYEEIAENLSATGEYHFSFYGLTPPRPSSFLPPVYPIFLAATRDWATGSDALPKALQVLASGLTVLSLYGLVRELGGSRAHGLVAAAILAVYPPAATYAVSITTVTLEMLFLVLAVWWTLRAARGGGAWPSLGAGAAMALAALTRPNWLVLIPLAVLWIAWDGRRRADGWRKVAALIVLAASVVLLPWVAYNLRTHGAWILTSTNGGLNFWIGNNPNATGEYIHPGALDPELTASMAPLPEPLRDRAYYRQGEAFIRQNPGAFLKLAGQKLLYFLFFRPNIGSSYSQADLPLELARWLFVVSWLALLPFGIVGLFSLGEQRPAHTWLILIFLSQAGVAVLYFAGTRFRTPADALMMIWAAYGLMALFQRRKAAVTAAGRVPG